MTLRLPPSWAVISCGNGVYRTEHLRDGEAQPEGTCHLAHTGTQAADMARLLTSRDRIKREEASRATATDAPQVQPDLA